MHGATATAMRAGWAWVLRWDRLLVALAAALALATALRLPAAWESGNALNHVSGAWLTLADDLANGTLYRPIRDPALGYGGTRFFPLVFSLHAGLLRLGVPPLAAGYALSLAAGALAVLGAFALLGRLGLPRAAALAFAALALGGFAGQLGLSAMRGDLLPVALSALGLAAAASPAPRSVLPAVVLFGLAFAAKPTALTAPAAAVLWLALRGKQRRALALALGTAALCLTVVLGTDALSGGTFTELLRACATGEAGLADLVRAPLRLAHHLAVADRSGLALLVAALAPIAAAGRLLARRPRPGEPPPPLLLPALWLAFAAGGALVVFASPGTGANHLVELEVASAVCLGAAVGSGGGAARVARALAPLAAAAGVALACTTWREDLASSRLAEVAALVRALPAGPVLSEDPLVPLAAGTRPLVLDAWMLRLAAERDPALAAELAGRLASGAFAAVVLFRDLDDPTAHAWFADRNMGLFLVGEIARGYRRAGGVGRYHLYLPRGAERAPGEARVTTGGEEARVVPRPAAR